MSYKIVVDQELLKKVSLDELIALQEGDLKALKSTFGRFVQSGKGEYLSPEEGAKYVGSLSMEEVTAILNGLSAQVGEVVPNE